MTRWFAPRHPEFSDTLLLAGPDSCLASGQARRLPGAVGHSVDPLEQLHAAERADWTMLRLVSCSAIATLLLGIAGSLVT